MKFRFSRKSDVRRRSEFFGLPSIPDPIDDNLYLASAVKAAIVDKESGAYDEFLFSENGISKMPFEESLESHLGLVSYRLADKGRRELLIRQQNLLEGKSRLALAEAQVLRAGKKFQVGVNQLDYQLQILEGEKPGRENLFWKNSIPEFSSTIDSRIKLVIPAVIFLVVGLVDVGIIFTSLTKILRDGNEALLFTLPAIGIQLAFPHLIGDRIRSNAHGSTQRKQNTLEATVLGILWLTFCGTLTYIRVVYLNAQSEEGLETLIYRVLLVLNFLMLVGLGSVLLFLTSKTNPHYREFHRVSIKNNQLQKRLAKCEIELETAKNLIPAFEFSHDVTQQSYEEAVNEVNASLNQAAKRVYRRALVNRFGDVDFTTSYLNSETNRLKDGK